MVRLNDTDLQYVISELLVVQQKGPIGKKKITQGDCPGG